MNVNTDELVSDVAHKLVQELADRLVEAAAAKAALITAATNEPGVTYKVNRIGDQYSVFNWRRVNTGIYETTAGNGTRLSVFRANRAEWYAQVGDIVLNEKNPVSTKVEAIELVEETLISI